VCVRSRVCARARRACARFQVNYSIIAVDILLFVAVVDRRPAVESGSPPFRPFSRREFLRYLARARARIPNRGRGRGRYSESAFRRGTCGAAGSPRCVSRNKEQLSPEHNAPLSPSSAGERRRCLLLAITRLALQSSLIDYVMSGPPTCPRSRLEASRPKGATRYPPSEFLQAP